MKIMTRGEITFLSAVIKTLAYKDLSFAHVIDDDAVYDLGRVLDDRKLRHRAQHLLQMVDIMPYKLESRALWRRKGWLSEVYGLMNLIDYKLSQIDKLENYVEQMHEKSVEHIPQESDILDLLYSLSSENPQIKIKNRRV